MQIAINITHEFSDVNAFAEFAGKLKALFTEFKVSVGGTPTPPADLKTPPALIEKIEAAVRSADPVIANGNGPAAAPAEAKPESTSADRTAVETPASVPSVPADVAPRAKRGRKSNAEKAAEAATKSEPNPAPLPVPGSFGGPATIAAPVPPAGLPVSQPAGGATREERAYVLEWIGRNGDAAYMKFLGKYPNPATGNPMRLTDLNPEQRADILASLRANDKV